MMTFKLDELDCLLGLIDGSLGYGRGLRTFPLGTKAEKEVHEMCRELERRGAIYYRRGRVTYADQDRTIIDARETYAVWTATD